MRFRKLRIAWSVLCGMACVLLIVLWVRSYWFTDGTKNGGVVSTKGRIYLHQEFAYIQLPSEFVPANWAHRSWLGVYTLVGPPETQIVPHGAGLSIPYWWLVSPMIVLSVVPWLHWPNRFSLRTLLIATTLVAVVLGVIVWMSRR